jgi:hypothetical protein
MSRWVRGIYNAAANFVLSGSLRAASGRTLDRDGKHLQDGSDQSRECVKSNKSCESNQPSQHTCTCHSARTCNCDRGDCADNDTSCSATDGKLPNNHGDSCTCSLCRDYRDYIAATSSSTIRTEGQGAGARIRVSNEPRSTKRANNTTRTDVEHVTGIPTGVTI